MNRTKALAAVAFAAIPLCAQPLVSADWLQQHRSQRDLVVIDTRPEAEYRKGHIPGAIAANFYDYLVDSSPEGERAFREDIAKTLSQAGLSSQNRVVLYEDKLGGRAGRGYWILRYAGHQKVHILEGGFQAWRAKGLSSSTDMPSKRPSTAYVLKPQPALVATASGLAARLKDPQVVILDVRTRDEFDGKGGSADCARQGRIPGAIWIEWTQFLSADGSTYRSPAETRALLEKHGITPDKEVVTYCHRGARAAAAWSALDTLGFKKAKNYVGSWHDWAAKKNLPAD